MAAREPESDHQSLHRRGRALASFALDHKACKDSYAMKPIENPSGFLAGSLDRQAKKGGVLFKDRSFHLI